MRSVYPEKIVDTGRVTAKISMWLVKVRFDNGTPYRASTSEMRSNTRPSEADRSSFRYSACAHTSGCADPAGRPKYIPLDGRSWKSQICSGSIPPVELNCSIALIKEL